MDSIIPHINQLFLFPIDETPLKQCTQCPYSYPATLQHFHPNKNYADGLNSACRDCRRKIGRESARRRKAGGWAPPRQITMISLICSTCGKEFEKIKFHYTDAVHQGQTAFFCSKPCIDESLLIPLPPSIKEQYLEGALLIDIANQYNTTINVIRRRLKSMGVELRTRGSMNTLRGSPMKGITHTPAARKKISDAAPQRFEDPEQIEALRQRSIKQMTEGRSHSSSRLEDRVALELSRQGFAFIRQRGVLRKGKAGYFGCVDFLLLDGRVIEVNGTYWHCDPRKYPNGPINETQKSILERYDKKKATLAEEGIPLIELWEIDLNEDMAGTIQRTLSL